jgi:hypothetical protein
VLFLSFSFLTLLRHLYHGHFLFHYLCHLKEESSPGEPSSHPARLGLWLALVFRTSFLVCW